MSLLDEIQIRIAAHGGAEHLADDIEAEWSEEIKRNIPKNPKTFSIDELKELTRFMDEFTSKHRRTPKRVALKLYLMFALNAQ